MLVLHYTKIMKTTENGKTQRRVLFACQDNLNNVWLYGFQTFAFSVQAIRLHDNHIIFQLNLSTWKSFQKLSFSVKTIVVFDRFRVDAS